MEEISVQSSQLKIHVTVQKLEQEKKEKEIRQQKEKDEEEEATAAQESNKEILRMEEESLASEEALRKSLIQDVIDEATESGSELSPAVKKLLHHFKCKYTFIFYKTHLRTFSFSIILFGYLRYHGKHPEDSPSK